MPSNALIAYIAPRPAFEERANPFIHEDLTLLCANHRWLSGRITPLGRALRLRARTRTGAGSQGSPGSAPVTVRCPRTACPAGPTFFGLTTMPTAARTRNAAQTTRKAPTGTALTARAPRTAPTMPNVDSRVT